MRSVDVLELLAVRGTEPADDERDDHQWNAREKCEESHFDDEHKRNDERVAYTATHRIQ